MGERTYAKAAGLAILKAYLNACDCFKAALAPRQRKQNGEAFVREERKDYRPLESKK